MVAGIFSIAVIAGFVIAVAPRAGWPITLVCAYVITLGGITRPLYQPARETIHYGIASNTPGVTLGDILLVGALLSIWASGGRLKIGWLLAAFTLPAIVLLLTAWGNTPEQWSGLKLYMTALIAYGIGRWLSDNLTEQGTFALACACFVVCLVQFVVTFAQSQGIVLLPLASDDSMRWIAENRMVGLYNHPATLGKTIFLLFCFLLPLSTYNRKTTRRVAYTAIALGSVAALLTLSRANTFAIAVAIFLWVILSGRATSATKRFSTLVIAGLFAAANTDVVSALQIRQAQDPSGGFRDRIFATGLEQIRSAPLTGTGPNYYSETVGQYDRFAATGYPLHNSILYPSAELGIALGLILFAPLLFTLLQSTRRVLWFKKMDAKSAALFSILPGFIAIAWTGWGMVATEILPLWFMGFGFLISKDGKGYSRTTETLDRPAKTEPSKIQTRLHHPQA